MTKTCPSCEILAPPEARYCRHCGTQLKRVGALGDDISPIAATMPLSGQNTTDEIVAPQTPPSADAQTSEVTHEELDDLLQQRGVSPGEGRDAEAERGSDGQYTPARDAVRAGVSTANYTEGANYAEGFRPDPAPGLASDNFDPEQTQITINVRPLTSRNLPADAAASLNPARANSKPQFNPAPQQVTLSPTGSLQPATEMQTTNAAPSPRPASAGSTESRALRVWLGMGVAILSIVLICGVAFAAFWFGSRAWRNSETPPAITGNPPPPALDPKQLAEAKLAEAAALIASGNAAEAQARLREAAALDPLNAEPQRRLARLLLEGGARREAIEALRAVTRLAPTDADAWRSLAAAQHAEGLYEDALASYKGLGEASPAALARDTVQLAYADTLRLSGRTSEARAIYRRLAASSNAEVANASRQQLGQPTPEATDEDAEAADAHSDEPTARETAARAAEEAARTPGTSSALPSPEPASTRSTPPATATTTATPAKASTGSPSEQYQRGIGLWATNRAAAVAEFRAAAERGNSDASYYLGLSIAEGRDPRALKRAELVAAIVYFGRARRGKFRTQSVAYEEQLGRELDRRRNQ
ncbi:MAG TPA: tetratricopeptide repeat protein [Pyrinomonadaceae bacterium]|jgi:tetratricopeptide (TPR) repeat protein